MRFFLDANIPYSSIDIFKKFNHHSEHARNIGMGNSSDKEIIRYAIKNNEILVTKDLGFGNILNYPSKSHRGIIILRLPFYYNAKQINEVLLKFLESVKEKDIKNALIVIDINKYRI